MTNWWRGALSKRDNEYLSGASRCWIVIQTKWKPHSNGAKSVWLGKHSSADVRAIKHNAVARRTRVEPPLSYWTLPLLSHFWRAWSRIDEIPVSAQRERHNTHTHTKRFGIQCGLIFFFWRFVLTMGWRCGGADHVACQMTPAYLMATRIDYTSTSHTSLPPPSSSQPQLCPGKIFLLFERISWIIQDYSM